MTKVYVVSRVLSLTCQGQLNLLKVLRAQLTNKTHLHCEKLNSYECLQILWGQVSPVPPAWFTNYVASIHHSCMNINGNVARLLKMCLTRKLVRL